MLNVLCKRNQCVAEVTVPCLAHMEQGPDPVHPEYLSLPYLPGYWGLGLLLALNKDGPVQCSGHLQAVLRIHIHIRMILDSWIRIRVNYIKIIAIILITNTIINFMRKN